MYTELIYQAPKAVIEERIQRASRPQPPRSPRRSVSRRSRARRAVAADLFALVVWTLLSSAPALAAGSTLYVSSGAASDPACASASQANPFATIAGALQCAANGTTINLGAGSFAGGFTIAHNVTLQGADAATVISDPSAAVGSVTEVTIPDGHAVTLKSLKVDGGARQHDVLAGSGSLTVINSTITGGVAQYGGGIDVAPATGHDREADRAAQHDREQPRVRARWRCVRAGCTGWRAHLSERDRQHAER
jgi:hypothetical protein